MNINIDQIVSHTKAKQVETDAWMGHCPAHDDQTPSLSIKAGDDQKLLLHCFAGCEYQEIVTALESGVTMIPMPSNSKVHKPLINGKHTKSKGQFVCEYVYKDETGSPLFKRIRYENPKKFAFFTWEGDKWIKGISKDIRHIPYNLNSIVKAPFDEWIYFTEGEKDCDRLQRSDLHASTIGSSSDWRKFERESLAALKNRRIAILPDDDKPGEKYAQQVATSLYGKAANVKIVRLPNLPPKGDISDWLDAGGTIENLIMLVEEAKEFQPDGDGVSVIESQQQQVEAEIKHPTLDEAAYYGLASEFVKLVEPQTEADSVGLLTQFLTTFGCIIGRSAYWKTQATPHYSNSFMVLVGQTSRGRKGTAWDIVHYAFRDIDNKFLEERITNGLASGEGLKWALRDDVTDSHGNIKEQGVNDKRLLVVEPEFANVLKAASRNGSTLSPMIRSLWDNGNLQSMTKGDPYRVTEGHVSIIAHITADELKKELRSSDVFNGFGNRFLWIATRRSKMLSRGGTLPDMSPITMRLKDAFEYAQGIGEVSMTKAAWELWDANYTMLERNISGIAGNLTARSSAQTRRIAMIYALLDLRSSVDIEHLRAALAVSKFVEDSVFFIFGQHSGDRIRDKILNSIVDSESGLSKTDIHGALNRNIDKNLLDDTLSNLRADGLVQSKIIQTKGRPRELFIKNNLN